METVAEKPAFPQGLRPKRRCLLPADGYYEWYSGAPRRLPEGKGKKPAKQPFYIHPKRRGVLAMAGIYEFWRSTRTLADPDDPAAWLLEPAPC